MPVPLWELISPTLQDPAFWAFALVAAVLTVIRVYFVKEGS